MKKIIPSAKTFLFSLFLTLLSVAGWGQATLPVNTTNLDKDYLPVGFSHLGLGSNYAGPALKFDNGGDYLVLYFSGTPGTLTFDLGVNGTFPGTIPANATFSVQWSSNGVNYTDLNTYSNVPGGTKTINSIDPSARYIRWIYTIKPLGTNIALKNINLTALSCTSPGLSFGVSSVTKNDTDANFTETATSSSSGAITYSSSNPSVATVNSTTGEVDVLSAGTATITASQAADGSYCAGTATYTLTVNNTSPFITTSGTLAALSTTYGTASSTTNFTVSAGNLSNDLLVNSPSGFEISLTAGSGYATSLNLGAGNRTNTPIYVRLASTTDVGTYSGNISLTSTGGTSVNVATASSTVNPKTLTITGLSGDHKIYDGNTSATLSGTAVLNGVVGADDVGLSGSPSATFANKNVGTNKAITVTGYTLSGTDAGNYTLTQPTGLKANITQRALTVTGAVAQNKSYDGNINATITGASLVGVISPDVVTVSGGGTFNNANVGTAKPVTANLILGGADGGNYSLTQPTGLSVDITKANPVFTTSTISINIGGTYILPGANISSTSDGTMTYSISGGGYATYDGTTTLTGVSVGAETLTVNQAASTNYNAGSTTVAVNVTAFTYLNGDVRPLSNYTDLSYGGTSPYHWEEYSGGTWSKRAASPQSSKPSGRIIIDKVGIGGGGNVVNSYNDIIILNGGELILNDNKDLTETYADFIKAGKKLEIQDGGKMILNGDIQLSTSASLIVKSDGTLNLNSSNMVNNHPIWQGTENFETGSTVVFKKWNWSGTATITSLISPSTPQISANADGYRFGNLILEVTPTDNWTLVPSYTYADFKLCSGDLDIWNSSAEKFITGTSDNSSGFIVGGNFTIYDGWFNFGTRFSNGDQANNYTIEGDFTVGSNVKLKLHHYESGTSGNGSGNITIKGNIEIGTNVIVKNDGTKKIVLETGNESTPRFIDITPSIEKTSIDINTGYRRFKKNLILGTNSKFTVKSTATLDFGFNNDNAGTTALNIVRNGTDSGTAFENESGSTLKITSPTGIYNLGSPVNYAYGNVRVGTRTYNPAATYHYIGKGNQVTGDGLPKAAANKHVIVELADDVYEFTSNNGIVRFNNPAAAVSPNFKGLEIKKGTVIADDAGNRFEDSSNAGEVGNLKMTGGIYKIYSKDIQPAVSGKYELSSGKIIFAHTTATTTTQAIRGASGYEYPNIEIEGKDVRYSNVGINMKSNGLFTVKSNAVVTNTGNVGQIVSLDNTNPTTLTVKNGGVFRTEKEKGFNGTPDGINPSPSVRFNHTSGNVNIVLENGSTVEYSRNGDQTITVFKPLLADQSNLTTGGYYNLKITGDNLSATPTTAKTLDGNVYVRNNLEVTTNALLKIEANKAIIVNNKVTSAGVANFIIESDGNLVQINDAAANVGDILAKRDLTLHDRQQYNYLISPTENTNLKDIYKDASGTSVTVPLVLYHSEATNYFYTSTGAYIKGRGLAVKEPTSAFTPTTMTAQFDGKPVNGSFTYNLVNSNPSVSKRGFNLIGNPYPSNIDLITFYNLNNPGNLSPTFYFWDNTANTQTTQMGDGYGGQAYAIFNAAAPPGTGTGTKAKGDPGVPGLYKPTKVVKVGQGFMAKAINPMTVTFNNSIRTHESGVGFFGKGATNAPVDRYWLNLISPANLATNIAVVYFDGGIDGYTKEDSRTMGGDDNIYSMVDGENLSINGKSSFVNTDVVPLGTSHYAAGNYTIALDKAEGVFNNGQTIYLKDKELNTLTDLTQGNYVFAAEKGIYSNRFEIVYQPNATLGSSDSVKHGVEMYRDGNDFVLRTGGDVFDSVEVFDTSGRLVDVQYPHKKETRIDASRYANGVYVLKVKQQSGVTTKRMMK